MHSFLNNKAGTGVDGWYWEFAYILTLDESKTCKIRTCYWENNNNEAYLLLVVNNKVICYLDTDLASEYDEEVYLDLLQVCKTKAGFDLVFSIGHDIHKFFGIRLDKDLNLVDLTNITPIFEKEYEKTSPEIRKILAKSKLLEA